MKISEIITDKYKLRIPPTVYYDLLADVLEVEEPITKNDLEVDCIDRAELLKAMDTWDKFGDDPNKGLIPLRTPTLQDKYVPYVKYDDMINCVKGMPSVTPQEPRKGHWIGHREHCENLGVMPSGLGAYEWCSNCDCGIDVREWHRNHYNFCPNCGADMREDNTDKEQI